jgi:propanol-preferring alcohol dehydrogenase
VQYAKIAGASVAAVDIADYKLDNAKTLGAEYASNSEIVKPLDEIQKLCGADVAIVLTANPRVFEQAFASRRKNGTFVMVALPKDDFMRLPIFETELRGIKVVSSLVGTRVDLAETFDLHADGRTRVVRESHKLEQVNKAVTELENG